MTGWLGLMGGAEYTPGCEEFDLAARGALGARVVHILPTAAAPHHPAMAVATARAYFARLGLEAREIPLLDRGDARSPAILEALAGAAYLNICGGDPGHLLTTLAGTPAWAAIRSRWAGGMTLAGSSAGAMVLAEWVLLPAPGGRRLETGLGLVGGVAVIPHFARTRADWMSDAPAGPLYLGLEERSGVWWDGRTWLAHGPGVATIDGAGSAVMRSGEAVPLAEPKVRESAGA